MARVDRKAALVASMMFDVGEGGDYNWLRSNQEDCLVSEEETRGHSVWSSDK